MKTLKQLLMSMACLIGLAMTPMTSLAGAGHDHGEAPAAVATNAAPSLSASGDVFEIVARLYPDELSIYVDHWASNAPVLNAEVEVEFNGKKAIAKFHADHGDYSVTDAAMLKALHAEGTHSLIFSVVSGKEADLLTGEIDLHDAAAAAAHRHGWLEYALWFSIALAGLLLLVWLLRRIRASRNKSFGGVA